MSLEDSERSSFALMLSAYKFPGRTAALALWPAVCLGIAARAPHRAMFMRTLL